MIIICYLNTDVIEHGTLCLDITSSAEHDLSQCVKLLIIDKEKHSLSIYIRETRSM